MSDELRLTLMEVSSLLRECRYDENAQWYEQAIHQLFDAPGSKKECLRILKQVEDRIAGMGSFSDMPLDPVARELTELEVRELQMDLCAKMSAGVRAMRRDLRGKD